MKKRSSGDDRRLAKWTYVVGAVSTLALLPRCSEDSPAGAGDGGADAGADAPPDAAREAGVDAGSDAAADAGADTASDAGHDASTVCAPGAVTCSGGVQSTCAADGGGVTTKPCLLGCSGTTCATLTPSNLPANVCDTPGTATLAETGVNDLDTGTGCDLVVPQSGGAPEICVRKYEAVVSFGLMHVTGPRALAIVATASMTIDGYIDAAAHFELAGPGASDPLGAAVGDAAGAGASTAGAGAAGTLAGGGAAYGTVDAVPLRAGAKGAPAGLRTGSSGLGGAGGGALQLVACGTLTFPDVATSMIQVTGGGGRGGAGSISHAGLGGGGGGSGGTLLIEAARVVLAPRGGNNASPGMVAAGGGGGGGGGYMQDGASGDFSTGGAGAPSAGSGGSGGSGPASAPVAGGTGGTLASPPGFVTGNGGSGGAAGRIRINTPGGSPADFTGVTISPPPTFGVLKTH